MPRRGSFRQQGTQVVTAGRARSAAEAEARRRAAAAAAAAAQMEDVYATPQTMAHAAPGPHEGTTHIVRRALPAPWPTIPQRLAYALVAWVPLAAVIAAAFASSTQFALPSALMAASLVLLVALPAHRLRRSGRDRARADHRWPVRRWRLFSQGLRRRLIGWRSMSVSCCWSATQAPRLLSSLGHRACALGRRSERSRPHRAQPDRPAAHRHRAHRALQLPVREAHGRHVHPAPRGHGRGPIHGRLRARHPRRAALAGHGLGRGAGGRRPASQRARTGRIARCSAWSATARSPSGCSPRTRPTTATARRRSSTADRKAQEAAHQPPHYVGRCAHLTAAERAAREAAGLKPVIRFRVGEGVVDVRRPRPRPRRDRHDRARRRPDHRPLERHAALPLHGVRRRRGHGDHATSSAARTTCPTRPSTSCCSGRWAPTCRSSPTCR